MSELIIYHNNRCSKSRQTLQLLEQQGLSPSVIDYQITPPNHSELQTIIQQLGFSSARQLMRKGEAVYKELGLDEESVSEAQLIDAMVANPKLIERPIVCYQGKSILGRPPENVLSLL
ncbi:MAG: arsenate reductase (glutaredoxin) [Paraglaciecola sp.]|uniref:arsenate reductase (glutaredoxin) n=1 Tax=Paraglaciecola sp. TaxID=1920173 RepID=UPI00273D042D|nr:arsenate reductase (glutaredoxin) [Paraglaciecola sp.]MDP5029154.1 arsenate reductase (glutaredoxin) [Paraglaciecola sp.]MDP5040577.1 arsenate reductase (glutaredoxin) [Paraglaciecola sp.]MDP5129393.1 arsenate reductase (glutaredoxin) [Paraglaciecola sp.]